MEQQKKTTSRISVCRGTLALLTSLALFAPAAWSKELVYSPVKTANPLKGFMPFSGNHKEPAIPCSMEFIYLPLKDLMNGPNSYTWENLDAKLDAVAGRGRQSVFRVYLDYPQHAPGVPDFLRDGPDGVRGNADDLIMRKYDGQGNQGRSLSPDYANPDLRATVARFIRALGERYDGDPRIGFIQIGLLGFWGEWHTFPYVGGSKPDLTPPPEVQEEILASFDKAFDRTLLLLREPKAAFFRKYAIGYHDDSFAYQTLIPPAWHFQGHLAKYGETERWRTQPIGGEVRPEIQPGMWDDPSSVPAGQDFDRCVAALHPSWMLANGAFSQKLSPAARELAGKQSRCLGYEFFVPSVKIDASATNRPVKISLTLRNTGVAPFYYDWPLEIAVLGTDSNQVRHTVRPEWLLTALLAGDPDRNWSHAIPANTLEPGTYKLLLRVVNPLAGGMALSFANTTQDADLAGWLSLGSFTLPSAIK